jgi:hypothetical protein
MKIRERGMPIIIAIEIPDLKKFQSAKNCSRFNLVTFV